MTESIIDSIDEKHWLKSVDSKMLFESFANEKIIDVNKVVSMKYEAIVINRILKNHKPAIQDIIDECNSMLMQNDIRKSRFEQWFTTKFNMMIESEKQKKISLALSKDM